jgi:hypothetical protein
MAILELEVELKPARAEGINASKPDKETNRKGKYMIKMYI